MWLVCVQPVSLLLLLLLAGLISLMTTQQEESTSQNSKLDRCRTPPSLPSSPPPLTTSESARKTMCALTGSENLGTDPDYLACEVLLLNILSPDSRESKFLNNIKCFELTQTESKRWDWYR